jgi:hypothetical protein
MIRRYSFLLAASAVFGLAACGGGSGSPGSPSGGGGGGGGTLNPLPGEAATITILPSGVTPKVVTVPVGSRVNFVNQSSANDEVTSDPHPIHTDCPPLTIGVIRPGQTGQTGVLNVARTCGYHDHGRSEDERWQGTIIVQ